MMRLVMRVAMLGAFLFLVAACAPPVGTDFVRPTADTVSLGTTTEAEVRARYGKPSTERAWSRPGSALAQEAGAPFGAARVSGTMSELDYYFADRNGAAAAAGVSPSKSVKFWFYNGRLAGWKSNSSFKADSSAFDGARVAEIQAWKTLRGDLIAMLGPPSGLRMYPMVLGEDQQMLTWFSFEFDTASHQSRARTLDVLVNGLGVVLDARYDANAKPIVLPPTPAYVPVPVYIPPARHK